MFADALAAILSKEIPAREDNVGRLLVTDSSGGAIYVDGTREACLKWVKACIKSIGQYPTRHADSIIRRSFMKLMQLKMTHHFDTAVGILVEYHPSFLRPTEEELRKVEETRTKAGTLALKRKREAEAAAAARKLLAAKPPGGPGATTPRGGVKKKEDPNCAPCHGQAYSGFCRKDDCPFDHDVSRCAAFKAAHPDGPPSKKP